ncbi:MAG: nucleotidyltransferase [Planctomycetes bacterium]|nr:nucleotidyltransferase [Planctomycetota bacterium]
MTADEYLQNLIARNRVATEEGSAASNAGNAVYQVVRRWAGQQLRSGSYSGSYAKETAIRGRTDVDIFISLKSDTTDTLKEIFDGLHGWIAKNGYPNARKQNVSVHVVHNSVEVDLVPAVHLGGNTGDHWLYVNKANRERTKTNVDTHINYVRSSGRINEIILTKIWRKNHNLDLPSFYLELAVIEALKYKRSGLADNFLAVLDDLSTSFVSARCFDPANTNNIISDDLTDAEKKVIASQAGQSRRQQSWSNVVW